MKIKMLSRITLACVVSMTPLTQVFAQAVEVSVPTDVLSDYKSFLGDRNVLELTDFTGEHSRRDVVELVLLQQALSLGGFQGELEFTTVDSYERTQAEMRRGRSLMSANTLWNNDLQGQQDDIYISAPIIRLGEFEAGFYSVDSNQTALNAQTPEDVKKLKVISNKAWTIDWNTLAAVDLEQDPIDAPNWPSMVKMVANGRGDVLLAPFQANENMSLSAEGFTFLPIPNVKIGLQNERNFAVSRHHPKGAEVAAALEKGISALREQGTIVRAFQESGFFNPRVSTWAMVE